MNRKKSRANLTTSFIMLALGLLVTAFTSSAYSQSVKLDLSKAVIVHGSNSKHAAAAKLLAHEIQIRTGIKLAVKKSMPSGKTSAILIGTESSMPAPYKLPAGITIPAKAEGYALWVDTNARPAATVYCAGRDDRGALFAAGRLVRMLYLSADYIRLSNDVKIATAPADRIRAQQIIKSTQSKDGFVDWNDAEQKQQHIRDMVLFGTNGFEPKAPENVDDLLEELGIDFFHKLTCQSIIDYDKLSDDGIKQKYSHLVGIDHITTYGGDASGSRPPQLFFPQIERVLPLILESQPGVKWWYSNQCLDDHALDYDDYIFNYFKTKRPSWLYGMVYGPWTKRGIREIRADLPDQYEIRHYPESCHVRWSQYPVPKWDRVWASIWPRNRSIYMMPAMMTQIHRATRQGTMGFLPYNHTGSFNDLNKFAWVAAGWDPDANVRDMLRDYSRIFFAHDFEKYPGKGGDSEPVSKDVIIDAATEAVTRGFELLEQNWVGPIAESTTTEAALEQWKMIAQSIGSVSKNWRVEMFLYKAFLDAQVKRKYDVEMLCEKRAYEVLKQTRRAGVAKAIERALAELAKSDSEFQSKEDFRNELVSWGLSDKFGNLDEVVDNIYTPLNDRYWIEAQLAKAKTLADINRILNYEDAGPGGFYDNLGVEGKQPHLVRQMTWEQDPGFVYSPFEWVDDKSGSDRRHSQLTHAVCRYTTPLIMRWDQLDPAATYHMKVVHLGPFGPQFTCKTDEGLLVHGVRGNTDTEPVQYSIPPAATKDGVLELRWELKNIVRGVSVTEIWLIKD